MTSNGRYDPWDPYHVAGPTSHPPVQGGNGSRSYDFYGLSHAPPQVSVYPPGHQRVPSNDEPNSSNESLLNTQTRGKAQQGVYSSVPSNTPGQKKTEASPSTLPKPRRHPFSSSFEAPCWKLLGIHVALSLVAFPVLFAFVIVAQNKTLFWTRLIIGIGCGLVGFCLGFSLINLGKSFLEAATWATLIHQSQSDPSAGITLREFAALSNDPSSAWNALRLLWDRTMYTGTNRSRRKKYDPRWWTLFIAFFLFLVCVAASLPFILGRLVEISARVEHQQDEYTEVAVKGDLSDRDLAQAQLIQPFFEDFALTWTLSGSEGRASAVSFPWEDDTVYFAEVTRSELLPNGRGRGTFDTGSTRGTNNSVPPAPTGDASLEPGATLRFPRWGVRIHCRRIPDAQRNIAPTSTSGRSYLFTPRDTVRDLFSSFKLEFPEVLNEPANMTRILAGDSVPSGLDVANTALGVGFFDNRIAHSFKSDPISMGADGKGFVSLETLLVRLNTRFTPNGTFPLTQNVTVEGQPTAMGYDGAICLELFEPWVMEVYNATSGLPSTTRIVSPGTELVTEFSVRERLLGSKSNLGRRHLNSTQLRNAYIVAHDSSINQLLKDNGRDAAYAPNPTLTSFTTGSGPDGYTELSEEWFADARARADASNILAHLVGTGDLVARSYSDSVLSSASLNYIYMGVFSGVVLVLGLLASLFVPKLPLGVPKRGFELYSWVAALYGDDVATAIRSTGIGKNMELNELERRLGDVKLRFAA
ncbi:hypothetical protein ONZ45_g16854 [Pleurotus djamor]|nr:hypothetical protein ONZ45_g16854 [Pleurotus djamor]